MNRDFIINEYTKPQKLPIWFVPQLEDKISEIYSYNVKLNRNKTNYWLQDIETVKSHMSERVIGMQYTRKPKTRWGMPQNILGFNVWFSIKNTDTNSYICVYNMDLKLDTYGLIDPITLQGNETNHIIIKESQLRSIIRETIRRILLTA